MDVGSNIGPGAGMGESKGSYCGAEAEERAFGEAWKAWGAKCEGPEPSAKRFKST